MRYANHLRTSAGLWLLLHFLPLRQEALPCVPDADGALAGYRQEATVFAESDLAEEAGGVFELEDLLAGDDVPEADRLVLADGGEAAAAGVVGDGQDLAGGAFEDLRAAVRLAVLEVPETQAAVAAGRGEDAAVAGEGDAV